MNLRHFGVWGQRAGASFVSLDLGDKQLHMVTYGIIIIIIIMIIIKAA